MKKDVKVFISHTLNKERLINKELDLLINDFKKHKQGVLVKYFGKEVPYHRPSPDAENAKLMHIHVLDKIKTLKMRHKTTSDSVLIYTEAATHINTYYIIDFIANDAHEKARDFKYMNWLIDQAEQFRNEK